MKKLLGAVWLCILAAMAPAPGLGQNSVRVRQFDWKVSSTEHFDIHYYEQSEPLVPFAAEVLERSYRRLSQSLNTEFKERKPFFLYARADDMQQSNIVPVGDGTGGVTEAFKDRFMVFHDGSMQWLDTVITHELTHVFQFHVLISGFWKSGRILKSIVYPLWMMEGMAEYYSWGFDDTSGTVIVRDAATSEGLIPLWKLDHFSHLKPHQVRLAYETGEKILSFLDTEFRAGSVERMLKLFQTRFETSAVLNEIIGLDVFQFERKWNEYAVEKYNREIRVKDLKEPFYYGTPLTKPGGDIPEFNTSPVFSPDGEWMAYLTTQSGFPAGVFLKNLKTGKIKKVVSHDVRIENVHVGNFTNQSRVLAMSKDGKFLAFSGTKNHRPHVVIYDIVRKKIRRIPMSGFQNINGISFSPNGKFVAFAGMKMGATDIYLMDLGTREIRQLTDDPQDDQTPAFAPNGDSIFYTSEIVVPGSSMLYQRRLYKVGVIEPRIEPLLDIPGAARDPYPSADGTRLLFSLEGEGYFDIYELDIAQRRAYRLTRSIGAAYTPIYSGDGRIAFSGFRGGSIHVYRGGRERFEPEPWREGIQTSEVELPVVAVSTVIAQRTEGKDFKSTFSSDLFLPAFFFSSQGGLFWTSYWQGSDMLGNHQVQSALSYASGSGFLDYQTLYGFNKYRTKLSFGSLGRARRDLLDQSSGLEVNEFTHAEYAAASYPLDRFHRVDLSLASVSDHRLFLGIDDNVRNEARIASASFSRNTVRGRYLVATGGGRLRTTYQASPRVLGGNFVYETASAEVHKYIPTGGLSALALRGMGVGSWGDRTPRYVLGGIGGVRGYGRSTVEDSGSHLAMATAEWRIPLFDNLDYYMWYIFPDFYFKAISFAVFTDAGYAWDQKRDVSVLQIQDLRHSFGVGMRIHTFILQLFPLVVHFDYAHRSTSDGGVFYVYLGPLF